MLSKKIFPFFVEMPYFTKENLEVVAKNMEISETTLNTKIQRAIEKGEIVSLKRGMYVHNEFFSKNRASLSYRLYISNTLLKPSYITGETALSYYGIMSEAVSNHYTAATLKTPRSFENRFGKFKYKNINKSLFNGFEFKNFKLDEKEYTYAIAKPYKAIFDYVYYKTQKKNFKKNELFEVLDDLRINYIDLSKKEVSELVSCFK